MQKEFETKNIVLNKNISLETKDLLKNMLRVDSDDRCDIKWILRHPALTKHVGRFREPVTQGEFDILVRNYMINSRGNENRHIPDGLADFQGSTQYNAPHDFFKDVNVGSRPQIDRNANYNFFDDVDSRDGGLARKSKDHRIYFGGDQKNAKTMESIDSHAPRGQIFERISSMRKSRADFFDQFGHKSGHSDNDFSLGSDTNLLGYPNANTSSLNTTVADNRLNANHNFDKPGNRYNDTHNQDNFDISYRNNINNTYSSALGPTTQLNPLEFALKPNLGLGNHTQQVTDPYSFQKTTPLNSYHGSNTDHISQTSPLYLSDSNSYSKPQFNNTPPNTVWQNHTDPNPLISRFGQNYDKEVPHYPDDKSRYTETQTFNPKPLIRTVTEPDIQYTKPSYDSMGNKNQDNKGIGATNWVNAPTHGNVTTRRVILDQPSTHIEHTNWFASSQIDYSGISKPIVAQQASLQPQYGQPQTPNPPQPENFPIEGFTRSFSGSKLGVNLNSEPRYNEDKYGFKNFMFTGANKRVQLDDDQQRKLDTHLAQQSLPSQTNMKHFSAADLNAYRRVMAQTRDNGDSSGNRDNRGDEYKGDKLGVEIRRFINNHRDDAKELTSNNFSSYGFGQVRRL